jgi:succinyl-CoA synthetase beta subunit/citryl-CoA synthetase large subunit
VIASAEGGIDVEGVKQVIQKPFSLIDGVPDYLGRAVAAELGLSGKSLLGLGAIITRLARCFLDWDAVLLECNPVILDADGKWWVADVHFEVDDDALYRQTAVLGAAPASVQWAERRSDFEQQALDIDRADHRGVAGRLVPFDGNIGLLIGGGGASLTAMDAILDAGLEPANYCEIGGNPSVWKIKELTKLILGQPGVDQLVVIMNVVSNTRVDLVARGVIKGVLEAGHQPRDVIRAFRIPGSWEDEGYAILDHYGVPYFGREFSIDQVVERIS